MLYLGDFNPGDTVRFLWNSNSGAGASITRATNGTISVYQNLNTTQTTTGVTDTEDFDGLAGVHAVAIDTSQDGTFYAAARDFAVVLSAATIDGQTVNAVIAHFSIQNRSPLRPTTAGRTLDVSSGGEAGVDWANVGSPTTTVNLSGTTVKTATDVETDTADIQTRLPAALVSGRMDSNMQAAANGVITANVIATDAIDADALAADAIAEINATVDTALADYDAPTNAELVSEINSVQSDIAALNNLSSAQAQTAAAAALTAYDAPTRTELTSDINSVLAVLQGLVLETGTIGSTGNSTTSLHLTGLTYGDDEINNYLLVIFDVSESEYHARWIEDWANTGDLATVAVLPFTPENAVDTYWLLPVRQDVTGGSGLDAAGVRAAIGMASANLDTQLAAIDDAVDSEIAAIITTLGTPAGASISADILTLDNLVDDLETRLGTPSNLGSGATIAANLVDIEGQTDDIGTAGAGLTAVPWNASWDTEVQSEVQDAIEANNLDHLVKIAVDTNFATTVHLDSVIGQIADNGTTATFDRTTDSLEALQAEHDSTQSSIAALNNLSSAQAQTAATAALTAYDPPTHAELVSEVNSVQSDIAALNNLSAAQVNAEVDTALADYDAPTNAEMVARTLVAAAYATAANQTNIEADTQDIQSRLPAALTGAGNMKTDALALNGSTTAAARLALSAATIVSGTAVTGTLSTTQMTTNLTEGTNDHYNGRVIIWTSGVLTDQATDITDYDGASKMLTYTAVTEAPSNNDSFVIV